MFVAGKRVK